MDARVKAAHHVFTRAGSGGNGLGVAECPPMDPDRTLEWLAGCKFVHLPPD